MGRVCAVKCVTNFPWTHWEIERVRGRGGAELLLVKGVRGRRFLNRPQNPQSITQTSKEIHGCVKLCTHAHRQSCVGRRFEPTHYYYFPLLPRLKKKKLQNWKTGITLVAFKVRLEKWIWKNSHRFKNCNWKHFTNQPVQFKKKKRSHFMIGQRNKWLHKVITQ